MAAIRLQVFGRALELTANSLTAPYSPGATSGGGWWPLVVREPYAGAWQVNVESRRDQILQYAPVFACVTLIAQDMGKLPLRLVAQNDDGVWEETTSPAFSPVLRKPNRYQTITKFVEQWITSKLMWGNAYVLKERDARGVVTALYVLDPLRVTPLIAPDGGVYYELQHDNLSGSLALAQEPAGKFIVPASEIIHDRMVCLFHPLVGMSPIYACAMAGTQGLAIQNSSTAFFTNGGRPSGLITAPAGMTTDQLAQLKVDWNAQMTGNASRIMAFTNDLKFTQLTTNAADAQLIAQLEWTAATICSCYHVPPFLIGVGEPPRGVQLESEWQMYHSLCIQSLITNFEACLDDGLGLDGTSYGTDFDIDDLIWMDTATKTKAAADAIGAGAMSPDEARERYFGLGPVEGGDTPYMQQQMFSLKALAQRDAEHPFSTPAPAPLATPASAPAADQVPPTQLAAMAGHLLIKALAA